MQLFLGWDVGKSCLMGSRMCRKGKGRIWVGKFELNIEVFLVSLHAGGRVGLDPCGIQFPFRIFQESAIQRVPEQQNIEDKNYCSALRTFHLESEGLSHLLEVWGSLSLGNMGSSLHRSYIPALKSCSAKKSFLMFKVLQKSIFFLVFRQKPARSNSKATSVILNRE